jgi:hypothetical protein
MFGRTVVAVLALAAAVETQAAPVAVTSCGQVVVEREAELIGDLDCSHTSDYFERCSRTEAA